MDELEADFLRFYQIFDYLEEPRLDGPKFIRLATQLLLYDGAVRRRVEMDQDAESNPVYESEDSDFTPGQTMSMDEALARSQGDDNATLHALNRENANSAFGPLFEYETA